MSQAETEHPQYWTRLSVMDFCTFTESMQTSFSPDYPMPCLGESDLNFVINAPLGYCRPANDALAMLYFDNANTSRTLPEKSYQITCTRQLSTSEFMLWAEQAIAMIRATLMHAGLACIDITDLLSVLKACESRKLILEVIPYEDHRQVPWAQLQRFRFNHCFAALFAGDELSLQMYSELGGALEEINEHLESLKLAATFHSHPLPALMLLGELET